MGLFKSKPLDNTEQRIGYWFANQSKTVAPEIGQFLTAGLRIKNAKNGPLWMVVNQEILSIIVTSNSWPGSLWQARVTKLGDMSGLVANPGYWRAREIELIEELPVGMLFGAYGDKIVLLLNQIITLTSSEVDGLYVNRAKDPCAKAAYVHAWNCWNEKLKHPRSLTCDDGMTLASPGNHDKEESPINHGFCLIDSLIWQKAREVDGQEAFVEFIEYGETEIELNQRWDAACAAFLYKAMELAMSQYLSETERTALTHSWSSVLVQEENVKKQAFSIKQKEPL